MKVLHLFFELILLSFLASATCDLALADPSTVVYEGLARFTILSAQLIRLEWSPTKDFVDAKTWVVQSRQIQLTPPAFNVTRNDTHLIIQTNFVTVEYKRNVTTTFNQRNIRVTIRVNDKTVVVWNAVPGEEYDGNLLGTIRTLDRNNDSKLELDCRYQPRDDLHCTYGVISRRGYAIVDDTRRPQFDNDTQWAWIVDKQYSPSDPTQCSAVPINERRNCGTTNDTGEGECILRGCCFEAPSSCFYSSQAPQDLYIFGHGHSYKQALFEFTRLSGSIPLPPRYIFGVFFSRYWAYAEYDERDIVTEYLEHDIPLDVIVTDMDWHKTFYKLANLNGTRDQAGQHIGWSGFTFDQHLFPYHEKFLQWCKQLGLKNTLNLHPASGIQPWEEKYVEMARIMGIDPSTDHYVPFNVTDKKYVTAWFDVVLHKLQDVGIDLWWLDWQQGEQGWTRNISYTNPTFWLNYLFFTDSYFGHNRPALLHRWGGLGNHRYQVGFSGDVYPNWDTLSFQPRFTATAANVGYGFWSHDLGGHMTPPGPELYTRWIQWGAFSPMFRTHCSKYANNDRRIWTYPWIYQNNLARFTRLRQALIPYLYTAARRTYDTGLSVVLPLYYLYPEYDQAYTYSNQYLFGEDILISPISQPINNQTGLVENWPMWFPPDYEWVNLFTGDLSSNQSKSFTLDEMPVYAKIGSIIPLLPEPKSNRDRLGRAQRIPNTLLLYTLLGGSTQGKGYVYEDDGISIDYQQSSSTTTAITNFNYSMTGNSLIFQISAASGSFSTFPKARSYEIQLRGTFTAKSVILNGFSIPFEPFNELIGGQDGTNNGFTYDGSTLSIIIYIRQAMLTSQSIQIVVELEDEAITHPLLIQSPTSFVGLLARCQTAKALLDYQWGVRTVYMDDYPNLLDAAATGLRITHAPPSGPIELNAFFKQIMPAACGEVANNITNLDPNVRSTILAQLECNTIFKNANL